MAATLSPDNIDFKAYMAATEPALKVRRASAFVEDLVAQFAIRDDVAPRAAMHSTKLGYELEFRPGEVSCWAGYNGHKKSFFTGQVALDLIRADCRVLMASLEMQPARTLARMARQFFARTHPSPESLAGFGKWTDGRLWLFDHLGRISPDLCLAVLRYFADELKGEQVVIDSMMMVCASEEHLDEQKQFTTDLVRCAQETGLHIHLVAHCRKPQAGEDKPPTKYDLRGSAAISDQAHNVLTVWANKAKHSALQANPNDIKAQDEPDALVTVEKQRNGEFEGRFKLWFDPTSLRFVNDRTTRVEPYQLPKVAA